MELGGLIPELVQINVPGREMEIKKRQGFRRIEPRKNEDGELLCLVPICNELRQKIKFTPRYRNYCKKHDFFDMREYTNWNCIRHRAIKRDDFCCVKCHTRELSQNLVGDHIIPIALGGDEFDINNVQTLCKLCDKIKTAKDTKDIAKVRRENRKNLINQKTV